MTSSECLCLRLTAQSLRKHGRFELRDQLRARFYALLESVGAMTEVNKTFNDKVEKKVNRERDEALGITVTQTDEKVHLGYIKSLNDHRKEIGIMHP